MSESDAVQGAVTLCIVRVAEPILSRNWFFSDCGICKRLANNCKNAHISDLMPSCACKILQLLALMADQHVADLWQHSEQLQCLQTKVPKTATLYHTSGEPNLPADRLIKVAGCHCKDDLQESCSTCNAALPHPLHGPWSIPFQSHGTLHHIAFACEHKTHSSNPLDYNCTAMTLSHCKLLRPRNMV